MADRFPSTFSFFLICGSSLSLSHAENEVSRLETAPRKPTCQISLFSLPIRVIVDPESPQGSEEILVFWYVYAGLSHKKNICLPHAEEKPLVLFSFCSYGSTIYVKHIYIMRILVQCEHVEDSYLISTFALGSPNHSSVFLFLSGRHFMLL